MGNKIKFGVYSNPSKDADGKESYHVRHETQGALNQQYIISVDCRQTIFRLRVNQSVDAESEDNITTISYRSVRKAWACRYFRG